MFGRVLDILEKLFRGHKKPEKVSSCDNGEERPESNGNHFFELIDRLAHVWFLLLVLNALTELEKLGLDQITINDTEDRLRAGPATPHPTANSRHGKDTDKKHKQEKNQRQQLLHVKSHAGEVKSFVVKAQQEEMVASDSDPGHT